MCSCLVDIHNLFFSIPLLLPLERRSYDRLIFWFKNFGSEPQLRLLQPLSYSMALDDLILTIESDAEDVSPEAKNSAKQKTRVIEPSRIPVVDDGVPDEKDALNPEFTFDLTGDIYDDVLNGADNLGDLVKGSKRVSMTTSTTLSTANLKVRQPGSCFRRRHHRTKETFKCC